MKGTFTVTLEFTEGCKTLIDWHGEKGSEFTSSDELELFEKALKGLQARLDKIQGVPDPRCKDCKHWGKGKTSVNAYSTNYVCLKRRKQILYPRFKDQVIYYAKQRMCKACEMFEEKDK